MMDESQMCSVREQGAAGDGKADDTAVIQKAIDRVASQGGGGVWFPAGKYRTGTLRVPSYVGLFGAPTWSYHGNGGTELILNDVSASALLDLTGSYGARVSGLGLNGGRLGTAVKGITLNGEGHKQEDTVFIEKCRIAHFSGDAIHLNHIWGFTVCDNMLIFNGGDGLNFSCWDGWVHDNIFNNNEGWGIHARSWNGAMTVLGNRIEWNHSGGVCIAHGSHYSLNNNYIDRSGGPGIYLHGGAPVDKEHGRSASHSIMGNVIHRSGARTEVDSLMNCHLYCEFQAGVVFSGNVMTTGKNDGGEGQLSPTYGLVYGDLRNSLIKDNTLQEGATRELVHDLGGNDDTVLVRDNLGCLKELEAPAPAS